MAADQNLLQSLPYDVRREWPAEWEILPLLEGKGDSPTPGPARYLHPGLEVRHVEGRGRGVVATQSIEAGTLLLLDTPIVTAPSHDELLEAILSRAKDDANFRRQLLSMQGDPSDEAARASPEAPLSASLVRNVLRHNYHAVERPPVDGELISSSDNALVGLWPLGSIVNHALHPNVTRSFAGHAACYRLIRAINAGDEVLDNYLDLRLPHSQRQEMMRANHSMDDVGPDAFDASASVVAKILAAYDKVGKKLEKKKVAVQQSALMQLAKISNACSDTGKNDPAFADIFKDFAILAGQLGDANMCLEGLAKAVEMATAREPFNVISYLLTLRMVHMACLAHSEIRGEIRDDLEALAREHFRMVFGSYPGAFEALNPQLTKQLASLKEGDSAVEGDESKRRKLSESSSDVKTE
mmetsp:Transcript_15786/g.29144  ORF Transcript_15786/g.29144 Transcript_15786/m.29144 type:complete len:412 (-) Transcript_15786:71-1306(-)